MSSKWAGYNALYEAERQKEQAPKLSPVHSVSPAESARPAEITSPSLTPSQALQITGLTESVSPAENTSLADSAIDLWASITDWKEGALHLPQVLVQVLYRQLDPAEQAIYTQLFALSWGFGKPSCQVSLPKLAERAGMKQTAAHQAIKRLAAKGMVSKSAFVFGKGKEQGVEYSLPLPTRLVDSIRLARSASPTQSVNNKINLKEINKKGFDASLCPDCNGTGMWYPEGYEKGAAKCRHEKLRASK